MSNVRWIVKLTDDERVQLDELVAGGTLGARKMKRALTLQLADQSWLDLDIAEAVRSGTSTVYRTRRRYVEEGLEAALSEAQRPGGLRKITAEDEAILVAQACSKPPEGRAKWTMQILADCLIVLTDQESVSAETVRRRLKEKKIKPWQQKMWCIGDVTPAYVARMEDVLDL
jgi:transposase